MWRLRTLGRLELARQDGAPVQVQRKPLVLLTWLARRSPGAVRRDELAALLWGDRDEARARHSLRQALLHLRRVLGEDLEVDERQVRLPAGAVLLDVAAFESEIARGALADAARRWHGEFLEGAEDAGSEMFRAWLEEERQALGRQLAWALEQLVLLAERRGAWAEAVAWAERWTDARPLDEAGHVRLVRALHLAGRTPEALGRHAGFRARLLEELGLEPSLEFSQLGDRLLDTDPEGAEPAAGPSHPPLVGRGEAFRTLEAAWRGATEGGSRIVVVTGEVGLGKTALLEAVVRWIRGRREEALVLRASGLRDEPLSSGWAVREVLEGLSDAPGVGGVSTEELAEASVLAPWLRRRFPGLPVPPGEGVRLSHGVAALLEAVGEEVPVLLLLDDFAEMDVLSRDLLLSVLRRRPARVLAVLTGRARPLQEMPELAGLERPPEGRIVELGPLTGPDLEELVAAARDLPAEQRRPLAGWLLEESGGHPLLAVQLLTHIVSGEDASRIPPMNAPPPGPEARNTLRRWLSALSPAGLDVLQGAAALGRPFEPSDLRRACRIPEPAAAAGMEELMERGFLREATPPLRGYAVAGAALGRAALALLGPERRDALLGEVRGSPPRARRPLLLAGGSLTAAAAVALWMALGGNATPPLPVLAVGEVLDAAGSDTSTASRVLPELLENEVARLPGLSVVGGERLREIQAQLRSAGEDPATLAAAARRAGATELLEGRLHPGRRGRLRADLRRVDLATGVVRDAVAGEAEDLFLLAGSLAREVARSLGRRRLPPGALTMGTSSLVALRLYDEGLRAYYEGDVLGARRLFQAALAEDPDFAMAVYYEWLARYSDGRAHSFDTTLQRAVRLAERAPDRERLRIRAVWADAMDNPSRVAVAETLAIRYPAEPDGPLLLGRGRLWSGEFLDAVPHLRDVVASDSLSLRGHTPRCLACDAHDDLVTAYALADSLEAAERTAREWLKARPRSARPWSALARMLEYQGRYAEALEAHRAAASLQPGHRMNALYAGVLALRAGDRAAADEVFRAHLEDPRVPVRLEATWYLVISLREQGRLAEALEHARAVRRLAHAEDPPPHGPPYLALLEGLLLLEGGEGHQAAALFDSIAAAGAAVAPPSRAARQRTWLLTQRAAALAAAGDTAALAALADTVEAVGRGSGLGRDRRLHHHVRGLLLAARGDHEGAAEQFRRAVFALTGGYARTNLELGRALLRSGRAEDAVPVLAAPFRGSLQSGNLWVSRTELHLAVAEALEAAGRPDSAAVHYRWVLDAWSGADPDVRMRAAAVSAGLSELEEARQNGSARDASPGPRRRPSSKGPPGAGESRQPPTANGSDT